MRRCRARQRAFAVAAVAAAAYVLTLIVVPLIDRDVDVVRAYPEDYASGAGGALVRVGYLSVALMALALAAALLRAGRWPERIGGLLLAAGSGTALVLAAAPQQVSGGLLLAGVFGLVLAPGVVSVALRRRLPAVVVGLGLAVTLGFATLGVVPREVAGVANRAWDLLLGAWGFALALTSPSGRRAPPSPREASR